MSILQKTAFNFGALSGLSVFAFFLLLHYAGFNPLAPSAYYTFWIPLLFMFLTVKQVRNLEGYGYISFGRAYWASLLTAISGGVLFALLLYIFGAAIDTNLLDQFKNDSLSYMEEVQSSGQLGNNGFAKSLYDASIESLDKATLSSLCSQEFFNKLFGGLFYSLFIALLLHKKSPAQTI